MRKIDAFFRCVALVFDSKCGADLEEIQSTLRPTSASLIGGLPPFAARSIIVPVAIVPARKEVGQD